MSSKLLTKVDILDAQDVTRVKVEVPEWGGFVYVQTMTADARGVLEDEMVALQDANGADSETDISYSAMKVLMVMLCVVDESGDRLFSKEDIKALGRKSSVALNKVVSIAMKLNVLTMESQEDLAKNTKPDPSGGSATS